MGAAYSIFSHCLGLYHKFKKWTCKPDPVPAFVKATQKSGAKLKGMAFKRRIDRPP